MAGSGLPLYASVSLVNLWQGAIELPGKIDGRLLGSFGSPDDRDAGVVACVVWMSFGDGHWRGGDGGSKGDEAKQESLQDAIRTGQWRVLQLQEGKTTHLGEMHG